MATGRPFEFGERCEGAEGLGQDRALVLQGDGRLVAVVADGAGGVAGGAEAADLVLALVREAVERGDNLFDRGALCGLFVKVDRALEEDALAGEAAAVLVCVTRDRVAGVSVGDGGGRLYAAAGDQELTAGQHRRPLLGSGGALPVAFVARSLVGRLVLATDGLWKYAPLDRIRRLVVDRPPAEAVPSLLELVRLPTGGLHDDVAAVVVDTL